MGLSENLKSKRARLGLGVAGGVVVFLLLFKFITSGGAEVAPQKERSTPRPPKAAAKPQKKKPTSTPLYETLKAWKDPFRPEEPQLVELQDKIDAVKREIEYLKVTLEEKKLKQEIDKLEKELRGEAGSAPPPAAKRTESAGEAKRNPKSPEAVSVKAIMISDGDKMALLVSGAKRGWVHQGEEFNGWEVKEITKESVTISRAGKTHLLLYDPSGLTPGGKS